MFEDVFTQAGLARNEATIYEYLLKNGESAAGIIIKKTPLKRGVVYNALADLVKRGLATERVKQKVSYFTPNHPEKLRQDLEQQDMKIERAKTTLEANLPSIVSDFNLVSGKPGMRIYEGKAGLVKVLNDSLNSTTEILTYADVEGMENYLGLDNDKYVQKRKELGLKKRGLVPDTNFALKYLKNYDKTVTEVRFVDHKKFPFFLEMEIYDGKISFMTFSGKKLIGMIIENKEIYKTQKSIFEMAWEGGKKVE